MYDLACHTECHEDLRNEIQEALADRALQPDSATWLSKLRKLESFMKESQRMNAITLGACCLCLGAKGQSCSNRPCCFDICSLNADKVVSSH